MSPDGQGARALADMQNSDANGSRGTNQCRHSKSGLPMDIIAANCKKRRLRCVAGLGSFSDTPALAYANIGQSGDKE
jgi:hypothetical protein